MSEFIESFWLMSIQASALILVVLLVRFILQDYKKMYSYWLWLLVLVRLLCPVFIESNWSLQPNVQIPSQIEISLQKQNISQEDNSKTKDVIQPATPIINTNQSEGTIKKAESTLEDGKNNETIVLYLQLIYLVGVTGFTIYFLVQYDTMRKRVAFAVRDKENIWLCEGINSPFVMGVIKPQIYLPFHISEDEKCYILRHEQAHITHMDPLVRMLGSIALVLHWWNPLVWYAIHKMNQDMEIFCDETALANATMLEKKAYSESLLQFAMKQSGIAVTLSFGESNTELRIKNILSGKRKSILIGVLALVIAILCSIAFLTIPKSEADEEMRLTSTEETTSQEEGNPLQEASQKSNHETMSMTQNSLSEANVYGDWLVNHIAGSVNVTALNEEEQRSFREARISYGEAFYSYYNNNKNFSEWANITGYTCEMVTQAEFAEMFPGITFDDLAVDADEMLYVTVEFGDGKSRFGDKFFVYDEIDIIIQYEGVFFWAQRIDDLGIEMHEGEYYYEITTGFKKTTVEAYASEIRRQILEHDWTGISEKISYPITIAGSTYQNEEEFLEEDMDTVVTEKFMQYIEKETCEKMFHNWQGIMMGETGEIWFAEVLNGDNKSQSLKIIAINISE